MVYLGELVGANEMGIAVGAAVGRRDGRALGRLDGAAEGFAEGDRVGETFSGDNTCHGSSRSQILDTIQSLCMYVCMYLLDTMDSFSSYFLWGRKMKFLATWTISARKSCSVQQEET